MIEQFNNTNPFTALTAREFNCSFNTIDGVDSHTCLAAKRISISLSKIDIAMSQNDVLDLPQKDFVQLNAWVNAVN